MSLRHHEIAEADNRILNPLSQEKLRLLGEICRLKEGQRHLDLACGKGEMLAGWAKRYGTSGIGVDLSEVFLTAARERAAEFGVSESVSFERGDAGKYQPEPAAFDIASCLGATWIGDGLAGTIELLRPALRPGGLMLIGEPYWHETPPEEAYEALGTEPDDFVSLSGTLDRFEAAGVDLVEMVLADGDSWDRYYAPQWFAISEWLRRTPADHPDVPAMREFLDHQRRGHLTYGKRYFGWGVFVLRPR
ncbi:methyltransferase domain-containing protein [Streptomyces sp. NPDC008139]|uniref:SAM-dependent methyltransferase n=1 Tax=Streptomyces sp. NPDC008139 TaxID=3364814 RepID=UPI0036EB4DB0